MVQRRFRDDEPLYPKARQQALSGGIIVQTHQDFEQRMPQLPAKKQEMAKFSILYLNKFTPTDSISLSA